MSFFEAPPPPPEEEPRERPPQPVWMGAGDGELGAPVMLDPIVLACTDTIAVAVTDLLAYPHGAEFKLSVRKRPGAQCEGEFLDMMGRPRGRSRSRELDSEMLRFGVQFADGRKATNLGGGFQGFVPGGGMNVLRVSASTSSDQSPPDGMILWGRGGGGSSGRYDQRYWLWPLPPVGPVVFVCEWPSEQIAETRVEVDSAPIRDAVSRAVTLWEHEKDG